MEPTFHRILSSAVQSSRSVSRAITSWTLSGSMEIEYGVWNAGPKSVTVALLLCVRLPKGQAWMDPRKKSNAAIARCVALCGLEVRCYPARLTIILNRQTAYDWPCCLPLSPLPLSPWPWPP